MPSAFFFFLFVFSHWYRVNSVRIDAVSARYWCVSAKYRWFTNIPVFYYIATWYWFVTLNHVMCKARTYLNRFEVLHTFDFQFWPCNPFFFSRKTMLAIGFASSLLRMFNTHLATRSLVILVNYFLLINVYKLHAHCVSVVTYFI